MNHSDSVHLLQECCSGAKMGSDALHDALDHVEGEALEKLLKDCRQDHESVGEKAREMLKARHGDLEDPSAMAKAMSYLKTNAEFAVSPSDQTLAKIVTQGCNMGVSSLAKAMNRYPQADEDSRLIARDLIDIETRMASSLRPYL